MIFEGVYLAHPDANAWSDGACPYCGLPPMRPELERCSCGSGPARRVDGLVAVERFLRRTLPTWPLVLGGDAYHRDIYCSLVAGVGCDFDLAAAREPGHPEALRLLLLLGAAAHRFDPAHVTRGERSLRSRGSTDGLDAERASDEAAEVLHRLRIAGVALPIVYFETTGWGYSLQRPRVRWEYVRSEVHLESFVGAPTLFDR